MPGLPEQIQKASPQELFPMGREDGGDWWVPLDEFKTKTERVAQQNETLFGDAEPEGGPDAEHDLNKTLSNDELTAEDLKVLITEYFSNQVLHCVVGKD